jgi:hypothetical protein
MRSLKLAAVLGALGAACGGRTFEIIPGYNGAEPSSGGTAGGAAAQGGGAGAGAAGAGAGGRATAGAAGFPAASGAESAGRSGAGRDGAGGGLSGFGGSSAGPPCEGAVTSDQFDASRVYLVGTLSEGSCGADAIAAPECPNSAAVGFDCDFSSNSEPRQDMGQIRPTDGRLLYASTFAPEIREFHCDACPYLSANANAYPKNVLGNDPVVQPPCTPSFGSSDFFISPEGALFFRCEDGSWQNDAGQVVYSEPGSTLAHVGYGGLALTRPSDDRYSLTSIIDLSSGESTPIKSLPDADVRTVRAALPDRFLVLVILRDELPGDGVSELWEIEPSGAASRRGEYPPLPTEITPAPGFKLLADGVAYQIVSGPRVTDDAVVRRELGGASEVVYTEADDPHVKLHISGLLTGP